MKSFEVETHLNNTFKSYTYYLFIIGYVDITNYVYI